MSGPRTEGVTAPLGYMPQLDGLRAIAVSGVVLAHFEILKGGATFGVHLFFVLSGFLITSILLTSRKAAAEGGFSRAHAFRQFYIRRALRIFPLYYLVILTGILLDVSAARDYAPWLLTYTINLKMASQGWYIEHFAHFWSLAVEEQHYLFGRGLSCFCALVAGSRRGGDDRDWSTFEYTSSPHGQSCTITSRRLFYKPSQRPMMLR